MGNFATIIASPRYYRKTYKYETGFKRGLAKFKTVNLGLKYGACAHGTETYV